MRLQVHAVNGEVTPELYSLTEWRIQFALGRFSPGIVRVDLYLSDENNHPGEIGTSCRLIVKLSPYGMLAVQDRDSDVKLLIDRVVDRLARSVGRELERRRTQRAKTLWEYS